MVYYDDLDMDVIFFFKQKTAYEMRISDWSSDVCSSDLGDGLCGDPFPAAGEPQPLRRGRLHTNTRGRTRKDFGDACAHGVPIRADLRRPGDDRQVAMGDPPAGLCDPPAGEFKKPPRRTEEGRGWVNRGRKGTFSGCP